MPGILLETMRGQRTEETPLWLMRQAGRYLPEYRALRAEKGGFLDLVYDSDAACEVTLQPIRRFGFDGAILFSDILIVPHALGQKLEFLAGEGPKLSPTLVDHALSSLEAVPERFDAIYRTVAKVSAALGPETTMLGFAGSPWTVATYMVAGEGSRDQHATREMAYRDPVAMQEIVDAIIESSVGYLSGQIKAGAEAVQLFDSWAGSLAPDQFEKWVIAPNARIVEGLKALHPDTPIIGFPKGSGEKLADYARETGVDAIGLDETVDPAWADTVLPAGMPVQGNLDPLILMSTPEAITARAVTIMETLRERPHVFNLGHGIGQFTPIENVEALVAAVRGWRG
ncbi:uroporphyrinogen decarboxylase [Qipengyuania sp. DSG2-2]|uniref:uroporphyrinogen decarboxylase n=1 Tax=Qipengyuania sp. DGS2-2 TaxID=3349631 RepID=UPI0036D221DF